MARAVGSRGLDEVDDSGQPGARYPAAQRVHVSGFRLDCDHAARWPHPSREPNGEETDIGANVDDYRTRRDETAHAVHRSSLDQPLVGEVGGLEDPSRKRPVEQASSCCALVEPHQPIRDLCSHAVLAGESSLNPSAVDVRVDQGTEPGLRSMRHPAAQARRNSGPSRSTFIFDSPALRS